MDLKVLGPHFRMLWMTTYVNNCTVLRIEESSLLQLRHIAKLASINTQTALSVRTK